MSPEPSKDGQARVQVLTDFVNSDLKAVRNEYHFRTPFLVDRWAPLLKDQRDEPMLCLILNIIEYLVPGLAIVIAVNVWQPPFALAVRNIVGLCYYLLLLLGFQERFILCLHFASHRPIFENNWALNELLMNWIIAPFFGIPCAVYKFHHVVMHHVENNHENDASATEHLQRDSLFDFFKYWARFVIGIWYDLPMYAIKSKRTEQLKKLALGLAVYLTVIFLTANLIAPLAAFWIFVFPNIMAMTLMSFGNWSQHIFVDPQNSQSNFGLTYNCMDVAGNQTTFNDGYHVIHHLNARLHWSEMPYYFHNNLDKHIENSAITFRGIHFFDVGLMVMSGNLRKLASNHYVHLGSKETAPTVDEVEKKLRSWLVPVTAAPKAKKVA